MDKIRSAPRRRSAWTARLAASGAAAALVWAGVSGPASAASHVVLVEATSANMSDLGAAVNQAVAQGAKFVSNSYGGSEDSSDTSSDSSYFDHPGVAITASTGDSAYGAEYPATSRGGGSRGWTESVWYTSSSGGTGSGCSVYDPKPSWQHDTGCSTRGHPGRAGLVGGVDGQRDLLNPLFHG